jgi:hypothetical protein
MKLQLQYVSDQKDPLIYDDLSEVHFMEIDPEKPIDLSAIIRALKAPHKPEETALQIFSNGHYLNVNLLVAKQFEENNVHDYR